MIVRDRAGHLVTDLKKADFEIFDRGVRQSISSFATVNLTDRRTVADRAASNGAEVPRPGGGVATNTTPDGRLFLVVLDDPDCYTEDTGRVRALLHRLVDRAIRDGDLVALAPVTDALPAQGFTDDRARLDAIIDRYQGQADSAPVPGRTPRGSGWVQALPALIDFMGGMDRIPATRKALVFVSEGWSLDALKSRAFTVLVRAAAAANVAIYPVNPAGLEVVGGDIVSTMSASAGTGPTARLSGYPLSLYSLAHETGGVAAVNTNDLNGALARIVEETGHYYLLGFTPSRPDPQPGRFHELRVDVRRRGLTVRARAGYAQVPIAAPPPTAVTMRTLATAPLPSKGLPLTLHAACFRARAGAGDVVIATLDADLPPATAGRSIEYSVIAADDHGRVVASDEGASRLQHSDVPVPIRIVSTLMLKPGTTTIKAAVRTDEGVVGSVFLDVDVPAFPVHRLTISDVEIGTVPTDVLIAGTPPTFLKRDLSVPPTAARTFGSNDAIAIYGQVYGLDADEAPVIRATVSALGGFVREASVDWRSASPAGVNGPQVASFAGTIDLRGIPAGPCTLNIEIRDGAQTAHRSVGFAVRSPI